MNETKKYLDYNGLETLVNIIKGTYAEKTDLSLVSQVATNAAQAATALENSKQDKLIAGSNIQIAEDGKTISATDTTYVDATTSTSGLMSAADKTKLDGVATGAQVNTIETIKVNGNALTPDTNKAVLISTSNFFIDNLDTTRNTFNAITESIDRANMSIYSNGENDIAVSVSDSSHNILTRQLATSNDVRALETKTEDLKNSKLDASLKGVANGVAELDANGKVLTSQLPSFVDDVIEAENFAVLPTEGETGKIYVTLDNNKTYRWSGSAYVEISASLALGETDSTAYRGDRGKVAYDHATDANKINSAITSGMYKVAGTADGHIASLTAMTGSDIEGLMTFATNSEIDALFN